MQAKLKEEERLAKEREEDANIAEWDNVQAMMDVDYMIASRLQAQEQEELTIEKRLLCYYDIVDDLLNLCIYCVPLLSYSLSNLSAKVILLYDRINRVEGCAACND
ncbi:hypothetical protein Tco_1320032 [Tanacetum coccineum]